MYFIFLNKCNHTYQSVAMLHCYKTCLRFVFNLADVSTCTNYLHLQLDACNLALYINKTTPDDLLWDKDTVQTMSYIYEVRLFFPKKGRLRDLGMFKNWQKISKTHFQFFKTHILGMHNFGFLANIPIC